MDQVERRANLGGREPQGPVLNLEEGQVFRPFAGDILPLSPSQYTIIARQDFIFKGVPGKIYLYQEDPLFDARDVNSQVQQGTVTPLGRVRFSIGFDENGIVEFEDSPICMDLSLRPSSLQEQEEMLKYAFEVTIAGRKFYLIPRPDNPSLVDDMFEHDELDQRGNKISIYLPYKPEKLREIEARTITRDQIGS